MKKAATVFLLTKQGAWATYFNCTLKETENGLALYIQQCYEYELGIPAMLEYNSWWN